MTEPTTNPASENGEGAVQPPPDIQAEQQGATSEPPANGNGTGEEKSFTQKDIDDAVAAAVDKAKQEWKEDQDEAKRLSKLTAEEREKEQFKKDRAQFAKEKEEFAHKQLITETKNQLMDRKLPASFAENLCGKDAETTKANIDAFEKDFFAAVEAAVTERMKGTPPKMGKTTNGNTDPFLAGFGI